MASPKKMQGRLSFRVELASKERLSEIIRARWPGLDESDVLREIVEVVTPLLERGDMKLFSGNRETTESPPAGRSAVTPRARTKTAHDRPKGPHVRM
jgi:hypothetical protein